MTDQPITVTKEAPDEAALNIIENAKYSVRQYSPNAYGGFIGDAVGFLWPSAKELLPVIGSFSCDLALRTLHYTQLNGLWGGAQKIWKQKILGTPYEISGGRNSTYQWQDIFNQGEFGQGYDALMSPALDDYTCLNRGMFIEKVSYGAPDTPIYEGAKILGLNHLDALRIYFTGNREWPYIYQSEWDNSYHKMHYTRVIHIADSPSPNTMMFGVGKSILYDSLAVSKMQIMMSKHQIEMLSDMPPPGIVLFNNIKPDQVEDAMKQFDIDAQRDGQSIYRAPLHMSSVDPENPATVQFIPLSQVPENYNYEEYMLMQVNILAVTMQLDPQDIWPLQSKVMGSSSQSKILSSKSDSKGAGYFLTLFERQMSVTVPRPMMWAFKAPNAQQDQAIALTASTWVNTANSAQFMSPDEKRQLVANQVPAFADVLLDETGNIIRLPDNDPKATGQSLALGDDVTELDTAGTDDEDISASDNAQVAPADATEEDEKPPEQVKKKNIDSTGEAFVNEIYAAIIDGIAGSVTKAGCAGRIRGAIVRYGKPAFIDGLVEGGVDSGELDEDDLLKIADDNVWDSQHVTDLVNEIFSAGGLIGDAMIRASLWISTLNRFYYDGLASADRNGMYEFTGDDGNESCHQCKTLKGQIHRMKDWVNKKLRPGLDHESFDCGTWEPNCSHYLEKRPGAKARGSWL